MYDYSAPVLGQMLSKEENRAQFANEELVAKLTVSYIEGWTDSWNKLHTRRGKISFSKISNFLDGTHESCAKDTESRTYRFRVLAFPRREYHRLKIGIDRATYQLIAKSWNLHNFTLDAFVNNNGTLSTFDTQKKKCILVKVAAGRTVGFDTLSLTHCSDTRVTNVLYLSLAYEDSVFDVLLTKPERCLQPTFFAAALYRCHQRRVEIFRRTVDRAILTIEESGRFGGPGRLFGSQFKSDEPRTEFPSDSKTANLSYVQTELAIAGHMARTSVKNGEWLVELAERDKSEWKAREKTQSSAAEANADVRLMLDNATETFDEMVYVKRWAETVVSQLQSLQDRLQSQVTFVRIKPMIYRSFLVCS
jgi:hypothetical protein